jgi:copper homeostasis protein
MAMRISLEVCVDTPEGFDAAVAGGADRIELCAALDLGGLTPSPGLMALAADASIPVYAMIRPRAGDFVFGQRDEAAMLGDIDSVRCAGLAGVVVGANRPDGRLDVALLERLVRHAGGLGITLHRAFDLVPDPFEALDVAIELGVERILTSGLVPRAIDGAELLRRLVDQAGTRVSIMPGSGVNTANVVELLNRTGAREVHGSCRAVLERGDSRAAEFGFEPGKSYRTSEAIVREMRTILDGVGS